MDQNNVIECGGFYFIYNFDSGNLGHVERVPTDLIAPSVVSQKSVPTETPEYEFNLWTRPDCAGTEFENGNRTWFYFGIQASEPNVLVRLNLINLNKQGKMYAQGMAPVTRTLPGKPQWERIRDRPIHNTDDNTFTLSFKYRTADNTKATTFFAFTYPFSFAELQIALNSIDMKMLPLPPPQSPDDIYYHRECLIYSLEGRRVDLLTISSHHGISSEREERLKNLFPEKQDRPFKFPSKKVIFVSARVHPGETPSSFVFNGFLNLLLNQNDPIAIQLRKSYVFKMIPFLNPDGVARGHYRTDTRGVNLNRVYLNPSLTLHPTVYASRALIRFYHYGCEKDDSLDEVKSFTSRSIQNVSESSEYLDPKKKRGAGFKGGDYYRRPSDKTRDSGKSSTTIKQASDTKRESKDKIGVLGTEAGALAEQVCDMSIRESPSQASQLSVKPREKAEERPLLNDHTLRACLGSNVHLSTSDELNFPGAGNPLRPLRDTLKNSISLLMGSTSSVGDSFDEKESRLSNVRMGWCAECRGAVSRLEDAMPGAAGLGAPFTDFSARVSEHTYSSIDEYREYQKKLFDDTVDKKESERTSADKETERDDGIIYFCTNCFKRYMLNENNEEILCDTVSVVSTAVSAGDSGSIRAEPRPALPALPANSTGDALPPARSVKEDKPKHKAGGKKKAPVAKPPPPSLLPPKEADSGLYLYLDLHGHASKKGIFMYGNHFDDLESCVECMLLPRIMSLNNLHFHFSSCNFTERNMYLKDRRDGMSREGSGRVAVFKATGLVRCYTLECNYNTGRLVNVLPPSVRDGAQACQLSSSAPSPPKYTPHIFEETPTVTRKNNSSPKTPSLFRNRLTTPRPTSSPIPPLLKNTYTLETRFSKTNSNSPMNRTSTNLPRNTSRTSTNLPRNTSRTSTNLPRNTSRTNANLPRNTSRTNTNLPRNTSRTSTNLQRNTSRTSTNLPRNTSVTSTNLSIKRTSSNSPMNRSSLNRTSSISPTNRSNLNRTSSISPVNRASLNRTNSPMNRTSSNLPMNRINSNLPRNTSRTSTILSMRSNRPQTADAKIMSNPTNSTIMERTLFDQTRIKSPLAAVRGSFVRNNVQTPILSRVNSAAYYALKDKISIVRPRYSQNLNITLEFLEEINPMEVGRSLGASILDLTGQHPNSRIPCSEHRNLTAVRDWLRAHTKTMRPQLTAPRLRSKTASPTRVPLYARSKGKVPDERKENQYRPPPPPAPAPLAPLAQRSGADIVNMNLRLRAPLPATPSRARYLDSEPKKALAAKRRNVLSIRKPNASKTHVGGARAGGKARRAADDAAPRGSLGKLKRALRPRAPRPAPHAPRALASSSSEDVLDQHWEDVAGGTALSAADALAGRRRPFPHPPAPHLKKIRLKASL